MLTEEPRRRFSIADPFAAESSSLKTSIVMELCDRGSLLHMREKIWAMMKQVSFMVYGTKSVCGASYMGSGLFLEV